MFEILIFKGFQVRGEGKDFNCSRNKLYIAIYLLCSILTAREFSVI